MLILIMSNYLDLTLDTFPYVRFLVVFSPQCDLIRLDCGETHKLCEGNVSIRARFHLEHNTCFVIDIQPCLVEVKLSRRVQYDGGT